MKRPQVSTNMGIMSAFAGFLQIYRDVPLDKFFVVADGLTYGDAATVALPFIVAIYGFMHDEKKSD